MNVWTEHPSATVTIICLLVIAVGFPGSVWAQHWNDCTGSAASRRVFSFLLVITGIAGTWIAGICIIALLQ